MTEPQNIPWGELMFNRGSFLKKKKKRERDFLWNKSVSMDYSAATNRMLGEKYIQHQSWENLIPK